MSESAGNPLNTTRPVKSVAALTATEPSGPASVSTNIVPDRSERAHTTADSSVTSPADTPWVRRGPSSPAIAAALQPASSSTIQNSRIPSP